MELPFKNDSNIDIWHWYFPQDMEAEVSKWKRMVDTKNLEICKFREELDQILGVLRELQRQGIKLPYVVPTPLS